MKLVAFMKSICLLFLIQFLIVSIVQAQATRTWVSGVGDDANPCSRTAPCKTFAGTISKTAALGEINVLDPGGFGGVTITKSISIVSENFEAGVLVSGTNAIIINGAGIVVTLKGLDIEGLGTGLNGVNILNALIVHIEECTINNFTQNGINVVSTTPVNLFVKDTIIRNNRGASSAAVSIAPPMGSSLSGTFDRVRMERNRNGIVLNQTSSITINDSLISGSVGNGINAVALSGSAVVNILDTVLANNGGDAVRVEGAGAKARLSNLSIFSNSSGLKSVTGGQLISFVNNSIFGNGANVAPTSQVGQQ